MDSSWEDHWELPVMNDKRGETYITSQCEGYVIRFGTAESIRWC